MQIILESIEELKDICSLIGTKVPFVGEVGQAKQEEPKIEIKPAAKKVKNDKTEAKKEEQPKVQDKEETPEVEAEVTRVDETPTDQPQEVETTEKEPEITNITKEMVRALCSKAIKAGKASEVKNIVSKYGASKLPELKEECYSDAYKDVEALL